jgi:predicted  nucleic acid-binding Zn-ribbon protein
LALSSSPWTLTKETKISFRKQGARRGRLSALNNEMRNLIVRSITSKQSINEKMLCLSELQKKIDDATEEMRNIVQHTEHLEHQHDYRDLRHEGHNYDNLRSEAYNLHDFLYDEASPLTLELQAIP